MRRESLKTAGLVVLAGFLTVTNCVGMIEETRFLLNPREYLSNLFSERDYQQNAEASDPKLYQGKE